MCSAPDCAGKGAAPAIMMCLDHSICMQHHPDRPPPAFYCREDEGGGCFGSFIQGVQKFMYAVRRFRL